MDNKQLIQNLILWFHSPVRSGATIDWLLTQFSQMREDILDISDKFDNLVNTARILESRISQLEERQDIFQMELHKVTQTEDLKPRKSASATTENGLHLEKNTEESMEK